MRSLFTLSTVFALAGLLLAPTMASAQVTQAEIDAINQEIEANGMSWTAGPTSVSQMDRAQFRASLIPLDQMDQVTDAAYKPNNGFVPENVPEWVPRPAPDDPVFTWRDVDGEDWTTPITSQGACGACTIFAATAAIEGAANVAFGEPDLDLDLAEQNLLDCTSVSCGGGGLDAALGLNRAQGSGVCDEACHPYTASDGSCGEACADFDDRRIFVTDWGWCNGQTWPWQSPTEQQIKEALSWGPVTTSFTVYSDFETYTGGVYEKLPSATESGGHAVVLIGWHDEHDSWYAKNSWGPYWGDDGYFEIKRGEVGIGGGTTAWCQVDASQITGVFALTEDWLATSLAWESGDTEQKTTSLQRTYGEEDMQFWVESGEAPWISVDPSEGVLGTEDVELTFTFDESNWDEDHPTVKNRFVYVIGEHGLSRAVEVRLTVYDPDPGSDTDTDSDSDSDSDSDADTDTDTDVDAGVTDSSDESGCGCRLAGITAENPSLIDLVISSL